MTENLPFLCEAGYESYETSKARTLRKLNPIAYDIEDGIYGNDRGEIKIEAFSDTSFYFEMQIGTMDCIGEISGIAHLKGGKTAEFSSDDCELLAFKFYEGRVEIGEAGNCSDAHGMRCTFDQVFSL